MATKQQPKEVEIVATTAIRYGEDTYGAGETLTVDERTAKSLIDGGSARKPGDKPTEAEKRAIEDRERAERGEVLNPLQLNTTAAQDPRRTAPPPPSPANPEGRPLPGTDAAKAAEATAAAKKA